MFYDQLKYIIYATIYGWFWSNDDFFKIYFKTAGIVSLKYFMFTEMLKKFQWTSFFLLVLSLTSTYPLVIHSWLWFLSRIIWSKIIIKLHEKPCKWSWFASWCGHLCSISLWVYIVYQHISLLIFAVNSVSIHILVDQWVHFFSEI